MNETKFEKFLGDSPEVKILQLLIEGREYEYTLNDIVVGAKVNRNNAYKLLKSYIKNKVITEVKHIKNFTFYKLNRHKREVKFLIRLYDVVIKTPIKLN